MRMGFGLVGILVVLGVIIAFMSQSLDNVKTGQKAQKKLQQQFGSNTPAGMQEQKDTIKLDDSLKGGKLFGLAVTDIEPQGPLAAHFGLRKGDIITAIGDMRVRDTNDGELSRAQLLEAKMRQQSLTILRNDQEMKLPAEK